jgi:hypothetical protein
VLLTDLITPVKDKNCLLRISVYVQTPLAAERNVAVGTTFAQWRTSEVEKFLTDPVGTRKLTVSNMD